MIGVAGALGNSELAAIRLESLKWNEKELAIDLPHAIDDGETQTVEIPFATDDQPCAVKALKDWLTIANLREGKVFRSLALSGAVCQGIHPNSIGRLVQGMLRKAQIYSPQSYGGHSLRIGNLSACVGRSLLTQAAKAKEDIARKRPCVDRWDRRAAAVSAERNSEEVVIG